jgi:hypothetical protein
MKGSCGRRRSRVLTGEEDARLVTLVCGLAPEGYPRWTLRLLKDTWLNMAKIELNVILDLFKNPVGSLLTKG